MKTIVKPLLFALSALCAAAWAIFGQDVAIAFGVGFVTMVANVWLTRKTVRQFTAGQRTTLAGLYLFKMVILFGLLFLYLRYFALDAIALVTGLGMPMAVMIFTGTRWMEAEDDASTEEASEIQAQSGV